MVHQNGPRIRVNCPQCTRQITVGQDRYIRKHHKVPNSNVDCTAFHITVHIDENREHEGNGNGNEAGHHLNQLNVEEIHLQGPQDNFNIDNQVNIHEENVANQLPVDQNDHGENPVELHEVPETFPHVYHNKTKEPKIVEWANGLYDKLNQLVQADRENDDCNILLIAIYRHSHPNSKKLVIQPNINHDDEDTDGPDELDLNGVEDIPIIHNNKYNIMWKAIRNGSISKARRAMQSGGIGDVANKTLREKIAEKYPRDLHRFVPNPYNEETTIDFDDDETHEEIRKYIFSFKRGQSASALGWSMDFLQDLLFYKPQSLQGIIVIIKLILNGKITGEARKLVYLGKGVPLTEQLPDGTIKPRPITIEDPIHKVAAHLLANKVMSKANEVCGKFQLGNGVKGGSEILVHFVRIMLETHPNFVLAKVDSNNAFNSPYHSVLLNSVNELLPEASSYLASLLREPIEVDYCNFQKKKCMRVKMERGIPQGNPMSGIFFNICRVRVLEEVRNLHPDIFIVHFHDDDYFLGLPGNIFAAIQTFDHGMDNLGIVRNRIKSQLYDPIGLDPANLQQSCEENGFTYVPTEQGIEVCGAPIGSRQFMTEFVNRVVNESIRKQLDDMRRVFLTPNGQIKKENQTVFQIVRMCVPSQLTYLLRTCDPDLTQDAARMLDSILDDFLVLLFDCQGHLHDMTLEEKQVLVKRIHLKFSRGGLGITPSATIAGAAFVGSITLCFNYLTTIVPNIKDSWARDDIRSYNLFQRYLAIGQALCPSLNEITLDSMCNKAFTQVQRAISDGVQKYLEEAVDRSIPQGRPVGGAEIMYARLDPWSQERAIQHMANKESFNYAFLTANPCARLCSMSNEAFTIAVQHRLLIPLGKNFTKCRCRTDVGPFFSHCYRCPDMRTRNQIRNSLHREMKEKFSDILKTRIETANLNRRVINIEPRLEDYFHRKDHPPNPEPDPQQENSQFEPRGFENGLKVRADMSVQMTDLNKHLIIDYTFVEPTSLAYIGTYSKAGQAAIRRRNDKVTQEYKHWRVEGNNQGSNKFTIIAFETFGVIIQDDVKGVISQFIHEKENRGSVLTLATIISCVSYYQGETIC
jgi:Reverse transcriptase (RNA-dependent DNA polymerase)